MTKISSARKTDHVQTVGLNNHKRQPTTFS